MKNERGQRGELNAKKHSAAGDKWFMRSGPAGPSPRPHRLRRERRHHGGDAGPSHRHHDGLPVPQVQAVRLPSLLLQHPVERAGHLGRGRAATRIQCHKN